MLQFVDFFQQDQLKVNFEASVDSDSKERKKKKKTSKLRKKNLECFWRVVILTFRRQRGSTFQFRERDQRERKNEKKEEREVRESEKMVRKKNVEEEVMKPF